jgi:hypothetical protein
MEAAMKAENLGEKTIMNYTATALRVLPRLETWDSSGVRKLLGELLQDHKPGAVRFTYDVLKRTFAIAGVPWPQDVKRPKMKESDISRPRYDPQQVAGLIGGTGRLDPLRRGLLAMSTVYGLRRVELCRLCKLGAKAFDMTHLRVFVDTAKGGVRRWQVIPPSLAPAFDGMDFTEAPTREDAMNEMFHEICFLCGLPDKTGDGWHAIRRAATRGLMKAGVSKQDRWIFFRRQMARDTDDIYVGELDQTDFELVDQRVLAVHPFMKLWAAALSPGPQR